MRCWRSSVRRGVISVHANGSHSLCSWSGVVVTDQSCCRVSRKFISRDPSLFIYGTQTFDASREGDYISAKPGTRVVIGIKNKQN